LSANDGIKIKQMQVRKREESEKVQRAQLKVWSPDVFDVVKFRSRDRSHVAFCVLDRGNVEGSTEEIGLKVEGNEDRNARLAETGG